MKKAYVSFTTAFVFLTSFLPGLIRAADLPGSPADGYTPPAAITFRLTAYSSSPDETDYNPFYTADGKHVHDGIVASNFLPFGTKIMIPSLFGNKIFSVEDRMAKRFQRTIDIWMPSKAKALFFGVNYADVLILPNGPAADRTAEISAPKAISQK